MRHAYLIMAHNDFEILEKSILLIDDDYNDIYIHIDKKVKKFNFEYFKKLPQKSKIYFVKRIDVRWASYRQIKCEYILFKEAYKKHYDYYHLLSGVDLPIVCNQKVYNFFEENKGKEFVLFDKHDSINENTIDRIKYYHLFVAFARSKNKFLRKIYGIFNYRGINIQKKIGINRIKKFPLKLRKGAQWISITDEFMKYVIDNERLVKKYFKYSYCSDELFIQTLLYNSNFYKNVYSKKDDDYIGIKRCIDWKRGLPYTYKDEDFNFLVSSDCFWARKFSSKADKKIIQRIYDFVMEGKND